MAHGDALKNAHPATKIISLGYNPRWSEGSAVPPVFRTSTFVFNTAEEGKRAFEIAYGLDKPKEQEIPALIYSRVNNPNMEILEDRLNVFDKTEAAAIFSSGMSAISNMCMAFLKPGDAMLFSDPVYGGTEFLFRNVLPLFDIKTYPFPAGSTQEQIMEAAQNIPNLKLLYTETPSNPTIQLTSVRECRAIVDELNQSREHPILLAVDNTFCGPIFLSPTEFGADMVVYSVTKFIGGHSDLVAGAVLGRKEHIDQVKVLRTVFGAMPDPDTAWLIMRSLPTLKIRMENQAESAKQIVTFLKDHPKVTEVHYPGLSTNSTHQQHVFKTEYKGSGSLISFKIPGGRTEAFKVLDAVKIMGLAVSLGGVESLIEHPSTMTHSDMTAEEKEKAGITESMIRISVGLEEPSDLIEDLTQALNVI